LVRDKVASKAQLERNYQTNRLEMQPNEERTVMTAWGQYAKRYGYET